MVEKNNLKLGDLLEKNIIKKSIKDNELVTFIPMEYVSEDGRLLEQCVTRQSKVKKGLTYFEKNDVIVAKITPCFENGKGACLDELATNVGYGSTEFHVLRARKDVVPRYIYYHTHANNFRRKLEREMVGSAGQKRVPLNLILKYPLQVTHSTKEQYKIATALSDIDNLIISVEKLINKKQKIKQGVMQELLTGKKRLTGFKDEWINIKLKELGQFISGSGFPLIYQSEEKNQYPFYKVSDFNNLGNSIYMVNANNYISEEVRQILNAKIIPRNSIVFAKIGAAILLERKRIISTECCIDNNMMCFIPKNTLFNEKLAYYIFHSIKLSTLISATALPSLSAKSIGEIEVCIPSDIIEQKVIAGVLTDIDLEIEGLKQKLNKYKDIKQGMMQELLTGRIRLI
ncbi:restriction endonuclease subunit S [Clostridium tertium]